MKKNIYVVIVSIVLVIGMWFLIHSLTRKKDPAEGGPGGSPSFVSLYNKAVELESKGSYLDARRSYQDILSKTEDADLLRILWQQLLGKR